LRLNEQSLVVEERVGFTAFFIKEERERARFAVLRSRDLPRTPDPRNYFRDGSGPD
jgi:hypothetical protein